MKYRQIFERYTQTAFESQKHDEAKVEVFLYNYRKYFPEDKDASMLDIGPGMGEMLLAWQRSGYKRFMAVDISKDVVDLIKRTLSLDVLLVSDIKDYLGKNAGRFDLVTMCDVIEHFSKEDILSVLESVKGSLQPGGRIIIQTPNMGAVFPALHRYNDFTHEVGFVYHSIRQVLKATGYDGIEISGFEGNTAKTLRAKTAKYLRDLLLYPAARLIRDIDYGLNPPVLHPVIYATATKPETSLP
jgi:2-polyprenyl-3-methyl-5-hydroxy-6-metoxy-1,4-benzoquinol methylase